MKKLIRILTSKPYLWLLPFFLLVIFFNVFSLWSPLEQDSGTFLTIANEILKGKFPYRDFFDHKGPAIYYSLAFVFKLFPPSLWAGKMLILVVNFLTAYLVYLIGKKVFSKLSGQIAALFYLYALPFYQGTYIMTEPFVAFFTCLAVFFLFKMSGKRWPLLFSGLMLGTAFLYKATAILALAPFFFYLLFDDKSRLNSLIISLSIFTLGFLLPLLISILYFFSKNTLSHYLYQAYIFNFSAYPPASLTNAVQGFFYNLKEYVPLLWIALIIGTLAPFLKKNLLPAPKLNTYFLVLFLAIFSFLPIIFRTYVHYWVQPLPFVAILAAFAILLVAKEMKKLAKLSILFIILSLAFLFIPQGISFLKKQVDQRKVLATQIKIGGFVKSLTSPEEKILALPALPEVYFLSNRSPLISYLYFSQVSCSRKNDEQIKQALQKEKVKYIIFNEEPSECNLENLKKFLEREAVIIKEYHHPEIKILKISKQ